MMPEPFLEAAHATTRRSSASGADVACHLALHDAFGLVLAEVAMPRAQFRQLLVACITAVPLRGQGQMTMIAQCNSIGDRPGRGQWSVGPHDGGGIVVSISENDADNVRAARLSMTLAELETFFERAVTVYGGSPNDIFAPGMAAL